jgi:hypothetical protein
MLDVDIENSSQDIPILMDFGSMGPARMDIKGIAEAQALQVCFLTAIFLIFHYTESSKPKV